MRLHSKITSSLRSQYLCLKFINCKWKYRLPGNNYSLHCTNRNAFYYTNDKALIGFVYKRVQERFDFPSVFQVMHTLITGTFFLKYKTVNSNYLKSKNIYLNDSLHFCALRRLNRKYITASNPFLLGRLNISLKY